MANVGAVIAKIREQGKGYKAHGNEWNVMNQLIDLVAVDAAGAELVEKDLDMPEMAVDKLVKKITRARLADPVKVMEEICKFYGLKVPEELPPEYWRSEEKGRAEPERPGPRKKVVSFMELLGGEQ